MTATQQQQQQQRSQRALSRVSIDDTSWHDRAIAIWLQSLAKTDRTIREERERVERMRMRR